MFVKNITLSHNSILNNSFQNKVLNVKPYGSINFPKGEINRNSLNFCNMVKCDELRTIETVKQLNL